MSAAFVGAASAGGLARAGIAAVSKRAALCGSGAVGHRWRRAERSECLSMQAGDGEGPGFGTVQVEEVVERMKSGEKMQLIDVRESSELAVVKIDGFIHLPLSENATWAPKIDSGELLDRDTATFCLCHHGMRSAQMCNFLVQKGFDNVNNISGGIDVWAKAYDMPTY